MLTKLLEGHDAWRRRCVNLVASENRMSRAAATALASDMGHRYYFRDVFSTESGIKYDYRGARFIAELYEATEAAAKRLFGADYANLNMLSGHQANLNVLLSHCQPGDTIVCTDTKWGGYPGLDAHKLPKYLGLNVAFIPQSSIGGDVDLDALERLLARVKPKIVMLSSSITIFPFPVAEVSALCRQHGVPFCYDASHPLGLIAGGQFQDPFAEGADMIIGSTHKSFPGPQGGIVLAKGDAPHLHAATDFVVVDNVHVHRIAALGITLREMEAFGADYARQIVVNAKALASELAGRGFAVCYAERGYTASHQFLLDTGGGAFGSFADFPAFTAAMEAAGLILDNSGRIGLSEMTRVGMTEAHAPTVAGFFHDVASGRDPGAVADEVAEFMAPLAEARYCFEA